MTIFFIKLFSFLMWTGTIIWFFTGKCITAVCDIWILVYVRYIHVGPDTHTDTRYCTVCSRPGLGWAEAYPARPNFRKASLYLAQAVLVMTPGPQPTLNMLGLTKPAHLVKRSGWSRAGPWAFITLIQVRTKY